MNKKDFWMLTWFGLYGPSGKLLAGYESQKDYSDFGMLLQSVACRVSLQNISLRGECVHFVWLPGKFVFTLMFERDISPLEERNWKECVEFIFDAQCHGLKEESEVTKHFDSRLTKAFLMNALISPAEIGFLEDEESLIVELSANRVIRASRFLPALGFLDYQLFFSLLCSKDHTKVVFLHLPNLSNEGFVKIQKWNSEKRLLIDA